MQSQAASKEDDPTTGDEISESEQVSAQSDHLNEEPPNKRPKREQEKDIETQQQGETSSEHTAHAHAHAPQHDATPQAIATTSPNNTNNNKASSPQHANSSPHATPVVPPNTTTPPPAQQPTTQVSLSNTHSPPVSTTNPAPTPDQERAFEKLPPRVKQELENLFASGRCGRHELAPTCLDALLDFDEETSCGVVTKFATANLSTVRSKTAFFIGILKRLRQQQGPPPAYSHNVGVAGYQQHQAHAYNPSFMAPPIMMLPPGAPGAGYAMPHYPPPPPTTPLYLADPATEHAIASLPPTARQHLEMMFACNRLARTDLPSSVLTAVTQLGEPTAGEVMAKFAHADMEQVNNKPGFLMGIVKRCRLDGPGGSHSASFPAPSVEKLRESLAQAPASVQQKFEELFQSGRVGRDELDSTCVDSLRDFPEDVACEIVEQFGLADMATLRSKTAFFIGVLKRYRNRNTSAF